MVEQLLLIEFGYPRIDDCEWECVRVEAAVQVGLGEVAGALQARPSLPRKTHMVASGLALLPLPL
jgi:hypothetical protein